MLAVSCTTKAAPLAQTPPMGWNSFDSYGVYLYEDAAMKNLDAFIEKLKPFGYEYFVIDAGWFGEYRLKEGTIYSKEIHASELRFNEYGILQPSKTYFPNGFGPLIEKCHAAGLKFGLHLMRGIPKQAVEANVPIKGTKYHARDIADTVNICSWCPQNYGVDMSKPGAQEFYDSVIAQMAEWGVDFIKYDDIVPHPAEVQAVVRAIKRCGRPIVLSLSPGGDVKTDAVDIYRQANMLRVTKDIWDEQLGIDSCFKAWEKWQGTDYPGFWIDMDMIPFGQLQIMAPKPEGLNGNESKGAVRKMIESGELDDIALFCGKGWHRWCQLSHDQMRTFITLRALSASPLMVGGDLPSMDDFSLSLLTNSDILACNQNGVMGKLQYRDGSVDVWKTDRKAGKGGWIGIFNRSEKDQTVELTPEQIGLEGSGDYDIYDVFNAGNVQTLVFQIPANGVRFLKYK